MAEGRRQSGGGRRNRARAHNRDREAEILNAARAVFERRGFDAASMAEIARAAEVAEGTIYLYCVALGVEDDSPLMEDRSRRPQLTARWRRRCCS